MRKHYSGGITTKFSKETPIMQELKTITKHRVKGRVILIDGTREFKGKNDYPELSSLKRFVSKHSPNKIFQVKNDIIRIYPRKF